ARWSAGSSLDSCQHLFAVGNEQADEALGLRREELAAPGNQAVLAHRKGLVQIKAEQAVPWLQANARNDGDTEAELDVFLDHFPAAGLQPHAQFQPVLPEHGFDDAPGVELARRQDEAVLADRPERDVLDARERMIERRDQVIRVIEHRQEADVVRHVEQRTDREIDFVAAKHLQAFAAGNVVKMQSYLRKLPHEAIDEIRQQVEQRRFAGGDVQVAALEVLELCFEVGLEVFDAANQRLCQFE